MTATKSLSMKKKMVNKDHLHCGERKSKFIYFATLK